MMPVMMSHMGYLGVAHANGDGTLNGAVVLNEEGVHFGPCDASSVETCFREAVEGYLRDCKETGRVPETPITASEYRRGYGHVMSPQEAEFILSLADMPPSETVNRLRREGSPVITSDIPPSRIAATHKRHPSSTGKGT